MIVGDRRRFGGVVIAGAGEEFVLLTTLEPVVAFAHPYSAGAGTLAHASDDRVDIADRPRR